LRVPTIAPMGLFDSLGSTGGQSKPPTTTTSGGLFGSAPSSNPSGGLFGNDKPSTSIFAQPVPPLEPKQSIFNQTAPQQQQMPSEGGDSIGDNNGQTAYFNTLLEKNKKRTRDAEKEGYVGGGMPKLELGLGDISRRVRELGGVGGSARADPKADSKAHYLLAASGVNPGSALRDLNTFSPAAGAPAIPQDPEWDPDSHKYVEQLQQQTTLKMIAEGLERAHRNFDAYLEDHVDINWEEQRRKVYEHFGLATRTTDGMPGASYYNAGATGTFGRSAKKSRANGASLANRSVFGASGIQKSVIGTPGKGAGNAQLFSESSEKGNIVPPVQDDRFVLERQGKFARKVQHLNESRLIDKDTYQILREFQSVESDQSGSSPPELTNAYNALIEMVGEGKDGKKVKQRQFRDDYLEDSPHSSKTSAMKKTILDGAKRALETKYVP
jgi:nuclear pore complex protein Nup93